MFTKPVLQCPVCKEFIGYLTKGETCSFVCKECQFVFTWDRKGRLLPPVKLKDHKEARCGCGTCGH